MNRVTLSFDNGPTPGITEGVLEVLARYGLLSTFFVIGQRLEAPRNAALLQAISAAGHWIGNHTWSHSVAFGDRPDAAYAREEIDRAQALIGEFAGQEKLFRPYGNYGLLGRHLFSRSALSYLREQRATPRSAGRQCRTTGAARTGTAISKPGSATRTGRLWFCTTSRMRAWPVCRTSSLGCRIGVLTCVKVFPKASS